MSGRVIDTATVLPHALNPQIVVYGDPSSEASTSVSGMTSDLLFRPGETNFPPEAFTYPHEIHAFYGG